MFASKFTTESIIKLSGSRKTMSYVFVLKVELDSIDRSAVYSAACFIAMTSSLNPFSFLVPCFFSGLKSKISDFTPVCPFA